MTKHSFSVQEKINEAIKIYNENIKEAVGCLPIESFLDRIFRTSKNYSDYLWVTFYKYGLNLNINLYSEGKVSNAMIFLEECGIDINKMVKHETNYSITYKLEYEINNVLINIMIYTANSSFCKRVDDKTQEPEIVEIYPSKMVCEE